MVASRLIGDIPTRDVSTVGLAGAPGSGKSSLARVLSAVLGGLGINAVVVGLDDYYLGREERSRLTRVHALFEDRGVPGTHDWSRLIDDLDRLRSGEIEGLFLPRFDKLRDQRAAPETFEPVLNVPHVVIVEGWLVGAPPQEESELDCPINALEAEQDSEGAWRRLVNKYLARYHADLRSRLDRSWFLAVPGWTFVVDWRWQQEQESARDRDIECQLPDRDSVERFLQRFERIARHMQDTCEKWADQIVEIDSQHIMTWASK